jgi:hypothetical protein
MPARERALTSELCTILCCPYRHVNATLGDPNEAHAAELPENGVFTKFDPPKPHWPSELAQNRTHQALGYSFRIGGYPLRTRARARECL